MTSTICQAERLVTLFCLLHVELFLSIIELLRLSRMTDTERKMIRKTVRIPEHLIEGLKEAGKAHYRNFNSELIVAVERYIEQFNADWKNKH